MPIGDPGPGRLFHAAVYLRGALTVQALRNVVGVAEHRRLLRTWARRYDGRSVTTAQFIALAERVSGEELDGFFDAWLSGDEPPSEGLP